MMVEAMRKLFVSGNSQIYQNGLGVNQLTVGRRGVESVFLWGGGGSESVDVCQRVGGFCRVNCVLATLKGPKHDQIECGFFYINPTSMGW